MSQITYIRLDSNYEPQFNAPPLTDLEAVGQAITTRLRLLQGEWWAALSDGLALFQRILGQPDAQNAINLIITQRIRGTPFVSEVINVVSSYAPANRAYSFSCNVATQFGTVSITNVNYPT